MKNTRIIWLILLVATACVCFQSVSPKAPATRIKVENDGGIIAGKNTLASNQFGYDPYFIHENSTPNPNVAIKNASRH